MTTFPHYITSLKYLPLENIFVPSEVPSKKLMIILHGRGGAASDFTWLPEYLAFDDMHYLLLNAPKVYEDGYSWYDDVPHHTRGIEASSSLLTHTLDLLFKEDFDASKSVLFGFSQGALLTFEFGARYAKTLAGYIAISGHLSDPTLLLKQMNPKQKKSKWLCTHGTKDEALNFNIAKAHISILQKGGIPVDFHSYEKSHVINTEETQMIITWLQTLRD